MQFVRTQTGYKSRKFSRKLYEMVLAVMLQRQMSKIEILRSYLGIVYMGSGLAGVSAAAEKVFKKAPYELSPREAAFIAAMMVYPRPLRPSEQWKARVTKRANYGLTLLTNHRRRATHQPNGTFGGG
jgi:membrane peptidoglycan carboxypeptidase